jgi:sugar phosphate isomerase/epimerase
VSFTAENWPITAALLQAPNATKAGIPMQDAAAEDWQAVFQEVADAGFADVDLTDSWVRPGDLTLERLDELQQAAASAGVGAPVITSIRRSVIEEANWQANLDYAHRTLEAAAALDIHTVSFGLHQELTPAQKQQLWFWTVEGHHDPENDPETWGKAVSRLRELGTHAAGLGIILSLELYEDTYLGSGDSAAHLVEDIGLHNVGINPDVGNLVRLHRPIEDWREAFAKVLPYANYWHVKNYSRDEDVARGYYVAVPAPLETGIISYREVMREAISLGFQGIICCEHYGGDGLSVSASNQRYLREQILPKRDGYALGTSRVAQNASEITAQ